MPTGKSIFKLWVLLVLPAMIATGLGRGPAQTLPAQGTVSSEAKPETTMKTVQFELSGDADLLIENVAGKRVGLDFKTRKFVNEIPTARVVSREGSATFILPLEKSGQPYKVTASGRLPTKVDADLTLTGAGFVVGFRKVALISGQLQQMTIATDGSHLSFTGNQDGLTPQLFLAVQSGRAQPSYRLEVSATLKMGKTITVQLESTAGRLLIKSDDAARNTFTLKIRRTNPGGTRDLYLHHDIPFSNANRSAVDFGSWDGKGAMCVFEMCETCKAGKCTELTNEATAP